MKIICLHGFLGLPSDWDLIQSSFMVSPLAHQFEWWSVDYMNTPDLGPECDFATWAHNFNQKILKRFPQGPRVIVGYSLGGRLALQALKAQPELYDQAVFISSNPGLQREKEKAERWKNDSRWSERFLNTPWTELLQEWNAQSVFKDSVREPLRLEASYSRKKLAQSLLQWSLAQQEDFRDFILHQGPRVLWACGEKDIKFASLAMELQKASSQVKTEIFQGASHRVLFDQPVKLAQRMVSFLLEKS